MTTEGVVYVVDDDDQVCRAVQALVGAMGIVCRGFGSAEEFLLAYDGTRPACLVTDLRMHGMTGLELQERLLANRCEMSVVMLTAFATIPVTVRAMRNGALTMLEKPCDDGELWEAVRAGLAADRENYARQRARDEVLQRVESLTPKEREVMEYVVAGDANKVIATRLGVSVRTVENHRSRVFEKMAAQNLAHLVQMVGRGDLADDDRLFT
ncbi:MAG: response regulator transcription factor [Planctomycetales bacterium]|nr:response regulator transcription factor [Planctomycetales bacterium]